MSFQVSIDLYSGAPNPTWIIEEDVAMDFRRRLQTLPPAVSAVDFRMRRSGFKGMTIVAKGEEPAEAYTVVDGFVFKRGADAIWLDHGRVVERWVFATAPLELLREYDLTFETATASSDGIFTIEGIGGSGSVGGLACAHAPVYPGNTGVWQGGPSAPFNRNNCYSYANNDPLTSGEVGLPGPRATTMPSTTAKMLQRLLADRLEIATPANVLPALCPIPRRLRQAHFIAVCWRKAPGSKRDFHCLRLDKNGMWSHKDGTGPVINDDVNGTVIRDLRAAQFDYEMQLIGFFASVEDRRMID